MKDNVSHVLVDQGRNLWISCSKKTFLNDTLCPSRDLFTLLDTGVTETTSTDPDVDVGSKQSHADLNQVLDDVIVRIVFYVFIFVFATAGNLLVIVTLAQTRRMRNVTNVFLFNLAISDLLLGVFCMPFTLVGSLLRDFVFGEAMCRIIPYVQAVSVSVSVWTLVAISLERFCAICRPLRSRKWQTVSHAYRMIFVIWTASFAAMAPVVLLSKLIPLRQRGKHKCREMWPDLRSEQIFNIYLDGILLVLPLLIMSTVYLIIIHKVRRGGEARPRATAKSTTESPTSPPPPSRHKEVFVDNKTTAGNLQRQNQTARQAIIERKLENIRNRKRRVILMLCVVVAEFFVFWTPLYVINTWSLFDPQIIYERIGSNGIAAVQLLAYVSSCSNPITYCFMNKQFRRAFLSTLRCVDSQSSSTLITPRRKALRGTVL